MKRYYKPRDEKHIGLCTDLAIERRRADTKIDGIEYRIRESDGGTWEFVRITSEDGAKSIGRPCGIYDTLNTGRMDLLDDDEIMDAQDEIAQKLCELFDAEKIIPDRILVVGLGNKNLTPDSVGPKAAERVKPTLHIKDCDEETFMALECSEIAVITPGVTAQSGIDSSEIVKGVCRRLLPDAVIVIDAFAARSTERLGSTVQLSNTGIFPGSGIGNSRTALSEDTLAAPVIVIGVPTVIDSRVFLAGNDTDSPLPPDKEAMLVSPKDIDEITNVAAEIIGGAINQAFGISQF